MMSTCHFLHKFLPAREPAWKRALHRVDPRGVNWSGLAHKVDPRQVAWDDLKLRAEDGVTHGRAAAGVAFAAALDRLDDVVHRLDEARQRIDLEPVRQRVSSEAARFRDQAPDVQAPITRARRHLPERLGGLPEEEDSFGDKLATEFRERWWLYAGLAVGVVALAGCATRHQVRAARPTPPVASGVDLERYTGTWHELARYPQVFQANCPSARAEYSLNEDGTLAVRNVCVDEKGGESRSIEGTAQVIDTTTNARLEVRFDRWWQAFVPSGGHGNYWIHWVSPDYRYAIVGNKDRSALWILGRETEVSAEDWRALIERVEQLGYDSARLERDAHTWVRNRAS